MRGRGAVQCRDILVRMNLYENLAADSEEQAQRGVLLEGE